MISAENFLILGNGIVTVCSNNFHNTIECNKKLSDFGWIVLDCWFSNDQLSDTIIKLQLHKIGISDCLVVTSPNLPIDDFMKMQIKFAEYLNKPIFYYRINKFEGKTNHFPISKNSVEKSIIEQFLKEYYDAKN